MEVSGLSGALALAVGSVHSLALMANGTVMAWGYNYTGQLGDGNRRRSYVPSKVCAVGVTECASGPYLQEVTAVAAGGEHSLALLRNGTVVAWGNNYVGELGSGNRNECAPGGYICNKVPVPVCTVVEASCKAEHYLKGVVAIAAGENHSLALLSNGTMVSWGYNEEGQLGDGTFTGPEKCGAETYSHACSMIPVAVSGLTEVTAIASGANNGLALLKNGTVKGWGYNQYGALGDGTVEDRDTPVAVCASGEKAPCAHALSGVTAIAGGSSAGYALLEGGTVKAWGDNDEGELGDGSFSGESCGGYCSTTPVVVKGLSEVTAIAAGFSDALVLLNSGGPMTWGGGNYGSLGNGRLNESGTIGGGHGNEVDVPTPICAAYTSGPCPSGPYLEGNITAMAVGDPHDVISFSAPGEPKNTALPVVSPATPDQAVAESTTNGTWTNSPTSYAYQWERCNATGSECKAISGATSSTYTPDKEDVEHTLVVKVTAKNSEGERFAYSTATNKVKPIGEINEYALPSKSFPTAITEGPEKEDLWFTDFGSNKLGKISTAGTITEYSLPKNSEPYVITAGPDGNLWFTDYGTSKVGKITPSGAITESALPENSNPVGIVAGPGKEDDLWFAEAGSSRIGKITPSGTITEYSLPTKGNEPIGITAGPDGNLWYTASEAKIGKITTSGTITEYSLPKGSTPRRITAGPDGNLWFTDYSTKTIGKITTSGTITEYAVPTGSEPEGITTGPDGNVWFTVRTQGGVGEIGKITTSGTITEYPLPKESQPFEITTGPDDNLWFTAYGTSQIGKITP